MVDKVRLLGTGELGQFVGDVFVVREAGNIAVSPTNLGSLEFGQAVLKSKTIVVLGHSSCGAVKAAFENEFTLATQDHAPLDRSPCFSSIGMDWAAPLMLEIIEALSAQGVQPEQYYAELGPGQFEINFGHCDDGLRAADWAALFCRSSRGVALKHGYRASFMSKPYLDAPGSGMHVHVSLYDRDGRNLLAADQQRPLRHAVAGCLELLPHCMPIFAANHNAFRRYGAMVNAASRASWGFEDRDACIRIPESDGKNLRIEHRLAGADANPYLVLAAILTGMEHGLDAAREPIAPLNDDRASGIDFPQDMLSAVAAMLSCRLEPPGAATTDGRAFGSSWQGLEPVEAEILSRLAQGMTEDDIAERVGLSEADVLRVISSAAGKMQATSRDEALALAVLRGLLTL